MESWKIHATLKSKQHWVQFSFYVIFGFDFDFSWLKKTLFKWSASSGCQIVIHAWSQKIASGAETIANNVHCDFTASRQFNALLANDLDKASWQLFAITSSIRFWKSSISQFGNDGNIRVNIGVVLVYTRRQLRLSETDDSLKREGDIHGITAVVIDFPSSSILSPF